MKKSLIAAAIAVAVAAPAANAGVIVYGKVHASIDYLSYGDTTIDGRYSYEFSGLGQQNESGSGSGSDSWNLNDGYDGWYVASRASRLGFKGTEDLGNGLSLIWKYETGVNVSDSPASGGIFEGARNSYIGLSGDWGTFLYGRHDTPMKMSTARLDLFSDQLGDYNFSDNPNNALLGPGFKDVRADNAIAYISPNWNGLTFAGAIIPGENTGEANGLADAYSLAAMYSNNGLYLAAAYEAFNDNFMSGINGGDSESYSQWRVGAGYTMNAFTVNALYENQDGGQETWLGGTDSSHDVWQISGAYDFGNNRIKAAYGENSGNATYLSESGTFLGSSSPVDWKASVGNDTKSTNWAIGWDHKLSKRTTAYAQYAAADLSRNYSGKASAQEDCPDCGEEFSGSVKGSLDADYDISGFSMGLIHTF